MQAAVSRKIRMLPRYWEGLTIGISRKAWGCRSPALPVHAQWCPLVALDRWPWKQRVHLCMWPNSGHPQATPSGKLASV